MRKKVLKLLILSAISAIATLTGVMCASAEEPDDVYITFTRGNNAFFVNFQPCEVSETPFLSDTGVTYVPLKPFAEAFGAEISWNGELKQITINYKDSSMLVQADQTAAMVNNSLMSLNAAPILKNSVTMIPIRAFADFVGADVSVSGNYVIVQKGQKPSFYEASHNVIYPPSKSGKPHTYTVWDNFKWVSDCGTLISYLGGESKVGGGYISSNEKGFVTYGDYYAVAMSAKFGNVGDMLFVVQDDNSVYPVMIADAKRQNNAAENSNEWGHLNGKDLVEFEILKRGELPIYKKSGNNAGEEFNHYISYVVNIGSVYERPEYIQNVYQALEDNGLSGNKFIPI